MKKALFCIDVTNNKKNLDEEGREFITREVDGFIKNQVNDISKEVDSNKQIDVLGKPLYLIKNLTQYFTIVIGSLVVFGSINTPLPEMYSNAPIIFYILPFFLVTWLVTAYISKKKIKAREEYVESNHLEERIDALVETVENELNIPNTAIQMDFIAFRYAVKNDEIKFRPKGLTTSIALHKKGYVENGTLCLADSSAVYSIPLSEITSIIKINKIIATNNWNKEDGPKSAVYKEFKLKVNQFGMVMSKPYYEVMILHGQNNYSLYVPKYEIRKFSELVGKEFVE